jgi:hypothetical protein
MTSKTKPPARGPVRVRKKWTQHRSKWMPKFLAALGETSNVTAAAECAGIGTSHAYKVRRTDHDFARKWEIALCEGYDNLEMELLHRLRSGEGGDLNGRKFDNAIALRLLNQHRESVSRRKAIQANEDADAILVRINAKLDLMRERAIAAGRYRPDEE